MLNSAIESICTPKSMYKFLRQIIIYKNFRLIMFKTTHKSQDANLIFNIVQAL